MSLTAALLAAALGACSSNRPTEDPNIPPANYKEPILEQIRNVVADPVGIRDAFVTEPQLKPYQGEQRYIACFKFNAKDERGQYAGSREMAAFYYNGRLTQLINADRALCGGVNYQPFPELTKLCRDLGCRPF